MSETGGIIAAGTVKLGARNLTAKDKGARSFNGGKWTRGEASSDPYFKLTTPNTKSKSRFSLSKGPEVLWTSKPAKKTLNPVWDSFGLKRGNRGTLDPEAEVTIQVFDWDRIGSNEMIGEAKFKHRELFRSGTTFKLTDPKTGQRAGDVYVVSCAEVAASDMDAIMMIVDKDGDGVVSFEEFCDAMMLGLVPDAKKVEQLRELFDEFDEDGDGTLSADEFRTHVARQVPPELARAATDFKFTQELRDRLQALFDAADQSDGTATMSTACADGRLDMTEIRHRLDKVALALALEENNMIQLLDSDGDGFLSMEEILEGMDHNEDGFITVDEFEQGFRDAGLRSLIPKERADAAKAKKKAEEERKKAEKLAQMKEEERKRQEAKDAAEAARKAKEAADLAARHPPPAVQAVLKKIGSCSSGYAWKAKAGGGYRCSAGGHTITQQQLDAHM